MQLAAPLFPLPRLVDWLGIKFNRFSETIRVGRTYTTCAPTELPGVILLQDGNSNGNSLRSILVHGHASPVFVLLF